MVQKGYREKQSLFWDPDQISGFLDGIQPYINEMLPWLKLRVINAHSISSQPAGSIYTAWWTVTPRSLLVRELVVSGLEAQIDLTKFWCYLRASVVDL